MGGLDCIERSPASSIIPPGASGNPVGLLHRGGHWDSVLLPASWGASGPAYSVTKGKPQPTADGKADDLRFQQIPVVPIPSDTQQHTLTFEEKRQNALRAAEAREKASRERGLQPHGGGKNGSRRGGSHAVGSRWVAPVNTSVSCGHERLCDSSSMEALSFLNPEQASAGVRAH